MQSESSQAKKFYLIKSFYGNKAKTFDYFNLFGYTINKNAEAI